MELLADEVVARSLVARWKPPQGALGVWVKVVRRGAVFTDIVSVRLIRTLIAARNPLPAL